VTKAFRIKTVLHNVAVTGLNSGATRIQLLLFDEPSAGLDPITSCLLDELILDLRDSLGTTIVIVSHELASIFGIGTDRTFLDGDSHSAIAGGDLKQLPAGTRDQRVLRFLTRGAGERSPSDE
jgi:phospholipid/cholesterol/gamma-HCH transport system ATP-binding protein